jgi:hypothetical protein
MNGDRRLIQITSHADDKKGENRGMSTYKEKNRDISGLRNQNERAGISRSKTARPVAKGPNNVVNLFLCELVQSMTLRLAAPVWISLIPDLPAAGEIIERPQSQPDYSGRRLPQRGKLPGFSKLTRRLTERRQPNISGLL